MDKDLFRQKSISRMQSPENLKEYIKVISPGLWIVFVAVILLLAGAFVWGTVGKIEDKLTVNAIVRNGEALCDFNETVQKDMKAVINGSNGRVSSVSPSGITISLEQNIADGTYAGYIVVGEISPISFVFN